MSKVLRPERPKGETRGTTATGTKEPRARLEGLQPQEPRDQRSELQAYQSGFEVAVTPTQTGSSEDHLAGGIRFALPF